MTDLKNHRIIVSKMIFCLILGVIAIGQSGCGGITNTIAGLTTPQSTISGSNYVYPVDPGSSKLVRTYESRDGGELIHAGDSFEVTLDFGFLRYLQAVDPYVIVYSETWMGPAVKPTDPEKTLRQVLLIKEGLMPNARLPITRLPLLGPVTMGEDYIDVHVALKVVVLSRRDNEQSIRLLEGVAGIAATAAPQYTVAAKAAADVAAAIVSQNRDKIEFEHTFTFYPKKQDDGIAFTGKNNSSMVLREGQIAVIKGESNYRVVPYQTWYYYLVPLNWVGRTPDYTALRFEEDDPIPSLGDPRSYLWLAVRIPFWTVKSIFVTPAPFEPFFPLFLKKEIIYPTELKVEGFDLLKSNSNAKTPNSDAKIQKEVNEKPHIEGIDITEDKKPYSQKSYMVFSITKTDGSLGNFDEIRNKFSEHATAINELTTSSSKAREISDQKITNAFSSIQGAFLLERAIRRAREEAKDQAQEGNNEKENLLNPSEFNKLGCVPVTQLKHGKDSGVHFLEKRSV